MVGGFLFYGFCAILICPQAVWMKELLQDGLFIIIIFMCDVGAKSFAVTSVYNECGRI